MKGFIYFFDNRSRLFDLLIKLKLTQQQVLLYDRVKFRQLWIASVVYTLSEWSVWNIMECRRDFRLVFTEQRRGECVWISFRSLVAKLRNQMSMIACWVDKREKLYSIVRQDSCYLCWAQWSIKGASVSLRARQVWSLPQHRKVSIFWNKSHGRL